MILRDVYERFAKKAPVSVMVRATIENVLSADRLNAIFQKNAQRQVVSDLMFSTVADIMGQVVCQIQPSVNAAYRDREDEIGVTIKAVYDKLQGLEPNVSRALVIDTAARMQAIIKQTGGVAKPPLAEYRTKIVDGNHLRRTDRRIGELRELNAAPLPGQALVVFDPQYRLVVDVLPCEDGQAAQALMLDWIAYAESSGIAMLKSFAKTLRLHAFGILAWYDHPISTGPLEGTNNKIKTMKRQAYGFRDPEFLKLKILGIHQTKYALVG